jgi:hypothetical protein
MGCLTLPLSFLLEINAVVYSQRVMLSLKKTPLYLLRGLLCPSSQMKKWPVCALFVKNGHFVHFKFEKSAPNSHTICRGLPHPTRSPSRMACEEQEGPNPGPGGPN